MKVSREWLDAHALAEARRVAGERQRVYEQARKQRLIDYAAAWEKRWRDAKAADLIIAAQRRHAFTRVK